MPRIITAIVCLTDHLAIGVMSGVLEPTLILRESGCFACSVTNLIAKHGKPIGTFICPKLITSMGHRKAPFTLIMAAVIMFFATLGHNQK